MKRKSEEIKRINIDIRTVHFIVFFCAWFFTALIAVDLIKQFTIIAVSMNLVLLSVSNSLMKKDFGIEAFACRNKRRIVTAFFNGFLYALLFAVAVFFTFAAFQDVTFLVKQGNLGFWSLFVWVIVQIITAFAEELFFRIYAYEVFLSTFRRKLLSIVLISLMFAGVHIALHGNIKQFFVSLVFSFYAFGIKEKRPDDSIYYLGWTHFIYNCLARFVFSV